MDANGCEPPPSPSQRQSVFKRRIVGDIFGSSMDLERSISGFIYKSRALLDANKSDSSSINENVSGDFDDKLLSRRSTLTSANMESVSDEKDRMESMDALTPKQQLAVTLKNWCMIPDNHSHIISEGGVHALVALTSIDDNLIRECCASAFYYLSSIRFNLPELLSLGAATGIITLSMQIRSGKVQKLCAMALCNLTMHNEGEALMAKEGALIAIMILLGNKGHKLLPICVQALYNLTCVTDHYEDIERIFKALINIPETNFDHFPYLAKAMVNCSRFSWIRLRMIEDGAVASLSYMLQNLHIRENNLEFARYLLISVRCLSESSFCRVELIVRGVFDVLAQLLQYCKEDIINQRTLIKSVYNLMIGTSLNNKAFELAVNIVTSLIVISNDETTLQYSSACVNMFVLENVRNSSQLTVKILKILFKILSTANSLTQYFSLEIVGHVLLHNMCDDRNTFDNLLKLLVSMGRKIQDIQSIQVFAITFSKLAQNDEYKLLLIKNEYVNSIIDTLLDLVEPKLEDKVIPKHIKESIGIAISRVGLLYENTKQFDNKNRSRISKMILEMLDSNDVSVLINCVGFIRILGRKDNIFYTEFSTDIFFKKISAIVLKYKHEEILIRLCCAVLMIFSCDNTLQTSLSPTSGSKLNSTAESIMNVIFSITKDDHKTDVFMNELIITIICNMSINEQYCQEFIQRGIINIISTISSTTSESILELCSKSICNITSWSSLHNQIIEQNIVDSILMISLVRSVGIMSKQYCLKSLLNLINDQSDHNIVKLCQAGVIRIITSLSSHTDPAIRILCSRGYLLFTLTTKRCQELVQNRAALESLYLMFKSKSAKTKILISYAMCNLLSNPISQRIAVSTGGLTVLKMISTMSYDDIKESVARVILSILQVPDLHDNLYHYPMVISILSMIISQSYQSHCYGFAICALASMSQYTIFRISLIEKGLVSILVNSIINGVVGSSQIEIIAEVCRCLCYLSYTQEKVDVMTKQSHIIFAVHLLVENILKYKGVDIDEFHDLFSNTSCNRAESQLMSMLKQHEQTKHFPAFRYLTVSDQCMVMLLILLRNLSFHSHVCKYILHQQGLSIIQLILEKFHFIHNLTFPIAVLTLYNLAKNIPSIYHIELMKYGYFDILRGVVVHNFENNSSKSSSYLTIDDIIYVCKSIELVSKTEDCCLELIRESILINFFAAIECGLCLQSCLSVACTLANISSFKSCRIALIDEKMTNFLRKLSHFSEVYEVNELTASFKSYEEIDSFKSEIQKKVGLTLSYLSEITTIQSGIVESMLKLSFVEEPEVPENLISNSQPNRDKENPFLSSNKIFQYRVLPISNSNNPNKIVFKNQSFLNNDCTLNENYLKVEYEMLQGYYNDISYHSIDYTFPVDTGGIVSKSDVDLKLPDVVGKNLQSAVDRQGEMLKVNLSMKPLDKDQIILLDDNVENAMIKRYQIVQLDSTSTSKQISSPQNTRKDSPKRISENTSDNKKLKSRKSTRFTVGSKVGSPP